MWIIGDKFVKDTEHIYLNNIFLPGRIGMEHFGSTNFKIQIFGKENVTRIRNVIAGIISNLSKACSTSQNKFPTIPKWIIFVLEDDLINSISYTQYGVSAAYGIILQYIMNKCDEIVKKCFYNVQPPLPKNVNRHQYPYIVWIEPTLHTGYRNSHLRTKLIRSMHNISQFHDNTVVMPLRQQWSHSQRDLVHNGQLSPRGAEKLWQAIDSTIKFVETKVMRNHGLKLSQVFQKERMMIDANKRIDAYEQSLTGNRLDNAIQANRCLHRDQHKRNLHTCAKELFKK